MFDVKPLIVVDVPLTLVLNPTFVGGFHRTVYEPVFSCVKPNVIDDDVDDILVGEFAFPCTVK